VRLARAHVAWRPGNHTEVDTPKLSAEAFRTGRVAEDAELLAGLHAHQHVELARLLPLPAPADPDLFNPRQHGDLCVVPT
jgi:hypothetical protein